MNLWVGCPPVEVIATTTTDADGFYEFTGLSPDDYTVEFTASIVADNVTTTAAGVTTSNDCDRILCFAPGSDLEDSRQGLDPGGFERRDNQHRYLGCGSV